MSADPNRCVAWDNAGTRCVKPATHVGPHHYVSHSFLLGQLRSAVAMYLAGHADRDDLARILADTEAKA